MRLIVALLLACLPMVAIAAGPNIYDLARKTPNSKLLLKAYGGGNSTCQRAIAEYNDAADDINTALRGYNSCLRSSTTAPSYSKDDCSSEFNRLKSAQDDFESAVGEMENYCR